MTEALTPAASVGMEKRTVATSVPPGDTCDVLADEPQLPLVLHTTTCHPEGRFEAKRLKFRVSGCVPRLVKAMPTSELPPMY